MSYYCTKCWGIHWKGTYFHEKHNEYEGNPPETDNKTDPSIDDGDIVWGGKE